jgi:hypothetical protein
MNNQIIPTYIDQDKLNGELIKACQFGELDKVKYLLTSEKLSQHADISCRDNNPLTMASLGGHIKVIDYLLFSPELKKHPDIHADKDILFHYLLDAKKFDIIKHYIFELNIEKTYKIELLLQTYPNSQIHQWFEMRDLKKS